MILDMPSGHEIQASYREKLSSFGDTKNLAWKSAANKVHRRSTG